MNSSRLQALLAYLVLHRHAPQPRRHLAFLLWPDSTEAQARTNLRNLLHTLRQALPDADRFLSADTHTLQWLSETPFTLDIADFETRVTQASTSTALREAVDLYQGELLPNCYDDWIQPERERLKERFVEGLERLVVLLEQQHDYRAAIRYAEHLLRQDPLREETYRLLMRLYAQSGDRLGVVRVYQTCSNVLKRELDAEVSPTTRAAYEQLVQMEISPTPSTEVPLKPRSNNLPIPLTSFIGQEKQIADLRQLLLLRSTSRPRTRLLTLTGAGGCGKTRLAIEVASSLVGTFKDGVWFVELASLSDPMLVPQAVATVLGVREQQGWRLVETLAGYLEKKEILLILDNCEHLLDACARLAERVLQACSRLQILATSRERLNIPGETVWLVPPLSLPDAQMPESFDELQRSESVRLLVERATSVFPTFQLNRQNAESIFRICQRLDGMPLAIELAAARVSALSIEQISAHLDDRFRLLTGGSRTALPRHQTLWDLLDWSYELLPEPERVLLRRLVAFSGGWTLEAAEAVCTGEGLESGHVLNLLTHLVDTSLITYDPSETVTRYHMYESIREYGWERLHEAGETQLTGQRHRDYFLRFIERCEPELRGPRQLPVLDQLEQELDNLRAALKWSMQNNGAQSTAGLRLAVAMTWFWLMKGYIYEGHTWLERALQNRMNEDSAPSPPLAKALCDLGMLALWQSDYRTAYAWLERGISMWQSLGDERNLAYARPHWAYLLWSQGDRALARALWEADAAVLRKRNDQWGLGWLVAWQARAAREANDFEAARHLYAESARLLQEVGDEWAYAIIISHLGAIELAQGNYASARTMFEVRLAIGQKLKSNTHINISHAYLGEAAKLEGDAERAALHFKEYLRLSHELGYNFDTSFALAGIAWVLSVQGEWRKAVILYTVAERLKAHLNQVNLENGPPAMFAEDFASACAHLDEATLASARVDGQALTFTQAIDYALAADS